jgi:hypothetical protein
MRHTVFVLLLLVGGATVGQAQDLPTRGGVMDGLFMAREGRIAHFSSYDRSGGNDDNVEIAPGETHTLVDHEGTAGVVRRWWVTIAPRNNREIQRQLIVRCYWDGEEEPSVEVPISDFFGMGFGEWKDYQSLPLNMTSGGYNSYWPMPFRESARITVENTSEVPVDAFYYNIDVATRSTLPDDALYFHAQYRQTRSEEGTPITILKTAGRGHYVGTLMSMQPIGGGGFGYLEGDQRIFVDGEEEPSIIGTGTEDYFSSGWYYDTGEYSAPYHGVTIKDEDNGRINTYRWHVEDPIPFEDSLHFTIEHGGHNTTSGVQYSSVAFWYQTHPHPDFPALPDRLLPLSQMTVPSIEAEALADRATATGGSITTQGMGSFDGTWGGDGQLWWIEAQPGDRLTIPVEVEEAGTYDLFGFFTRAGDYGIVRVHVNGQALRPLVDGYSTEVEPTGPISFGRVPLDTGTNEIVVELIGKDARSSGYSEGYLVGVDGFLLRE